MLAVLCALLGAAQAQTNDLREATFDELLVQAQRYGNTEAKRKAKQLARAEFEARGTNSLAYLITRCHIENIWIRLLAQKTVDDLEADDAAPILLAALNSPHAPVCKHATYFLGRLDTPQHADRVRPLLMDEETIGVALRTLGKWGVRGAVPDIVPFLTHDKERIRITAANALGAIADARAASPLIQAVGDPVFTVRKAAARALVSIGKPAESPVLEALPVSSGPTRRELIRVLAQSGSRKALRPLRRLLGDPDRQVRRDAARALWQLRPDHARKWLAGAHIDPGLIDQLTAASSSALY